MTAKKTFNQRVQAWAYGHGKLTGKGRQLKKSFKIVEKQVNQLGGGKTKKK